MKNLRKTGHVAMVSLILLLVFALGGCGTPDPVDSEAVKACLDVGWQPVYFSNGMKTEFTCRPLKGN